MLANDPAWRRRSRRPSPNRTALPGASRPVRRDRFSLASVPGVVIGKYTKIAWGLTTSYLDVEDLYLEDVRGHRTCG
jgi:acyl-homoserine lactone acylase PvdQ